MAVWQKYAQAILKGVKDLPVGTGVIDESVAVFMEQHLAQRTQPDAPLAPTLMMTGMDPKELNRDLIVEEHRSFDKLGSEAWAQLSADTRSSLCDQAESILSAADCERERLTRAFSVSLLDELLSYQPLAAGVASVTSQRLITSSSGTQSAPSDSSETLITPASGRLYVQDSARATRSRDSQRYRISHIVERAHLKNLLSPHEDLHGLNAGSLKQRLTSAQLQRLIEEAGVQDQVTLHILKAIRGISLEQAAGMTVTTSENLDCPSVLSQAQGRGIIGESDRSTLFCDRAFYGCEKCKQSFLTRGCQFPDLIYCPRGCGLMAKQAAAPTPHDETTSVTMPLQYEEVLLPSSKTQLPAPVRSPEKSSIQKKLAVDFSESPTILVSGTDIGSGAAVAAPSKVGVRDLIGQSFGDWTLSDLLGKGGMGAVYKASDSRGRQAAVKVVLPSLGDVLTYMPRFEQEARVTEALDHPGIIKFLGFHREPMPHLILEFVPGTDLKKLLKKQRRFPMTEAVKKAIKILEALNYAHSKEIVHRDLKPENVLLSDDGAIIVSDFGLGRDNKDDDAPRLTLSGLGMGTPLYMSPEQIDDAKHVDHRSDLYSFGVMLFHFIVGQAPFTGSQAQILTAHCMRQPADIRAWVPEVPASLSELVAVLLAKEPKDRPQSAKEALETLKAIDRELAEGKKERSAGQEIALGAGDQVGDWIIESELGSGGMGKVFLASSQGQKTALKVLSATVADDKVMLKRFEREIAVTKDLDHQNIVTVFDSGVAEVKGRSYPFMAMEVATSDLAARISGGGPLPPGEAVVAALAAGGGLLHAHGKGVIHRDVKPENLLIFGDTITTESVRVTDFGVATFTHQNSDLTQTMAALGSPHYMAPEQARNIEDLDGRADVYALGASLFHLVTGRRLFTAETAQGLLVAHAAELPPRADVVFAKVPAPLALVIDSAVLKRVEDRPGLAEFLEDLEDFKNGKLKRGRLKELKKQVAAGRRPFEKRSAVKQILIFTVLLIAISGVAIWQSFNKPVIDPFATARSRLESIREQLTGIQTKPDKTAINACFVEIKGLAKELREAEQNGLTIPKELKEAKLSVSEQADQSCWSFLLDRVEALESDPGGEGVDKALQTATEMLTNFKTRIVNRQWKAEYEKKIQSLEDDLKSVRLIRAIAAKLQLTDKAIADKAWEKVWLPGKQGKGDAGLLAEAEKQISDFEDNFGKPKVAAHRKQLTKFKEDWKAGYGALEKALKELQMKKREAQTADEVAAVKDDLKKFLAAIPSGNERILKATQDVLNKEDLRQVKARELLSRVQKRMNTSQDFHLLINDLRELRDNYKDYPENAQATPLLREVEKKRDRAASEALQQLCKTQKERLKKEELESTLTVKGFVTLGRELDEFMELKVFKGWSEMNSECAKHRAFLESAHKNYGKTLQTQAIAGIKKRDSNWSQGAFLKHLRRVESTVKAALEFPLVNKEQLAYIKKTIGYLRALHKVGAGAAMAKLEGGTTVIGYYEVRFAHHPPIKDHKVETFLMDRREVSVAQYKRFLEFVKFFNKAYVDIEDVPYCMDEWKALEDGPKLPMREVTLEEARAFARWAGKRLPTEFEWEYAARSRGQRKGPYAWGDKNPDSSLVCFGKVEEDEGPVATDEKSAGATEQGLFHMCGNVFEWTESQYIPYPGGDPKLFKTAGFYVKRGGAYDSLFDELYIWYRKDQSQSERNNNTGFRCVVKP
jgi:serine/threonine protein kinase/formylglycine-generating enzyme required for sulfatase activity